MLAGTPAARHAGLERRAVGHCRHCPHCRCSCAATITPKCCTYDGHGGLQPRRARPGDVAPGGGELLPLVQRVALPPVMTRL